MATYDESAESAESAQPAEDTEGAVPADIQAERERRLDPANRPANAEVDNTGKTLPTVEEFKELNAGEDVEGAAGSSDPGAAFRRIQPSEEEIAEIEAERERRLDPANRPANAEVDYTGENMPDVARD